MTPPHHRSGGEAAHAAAGRAAPPTRIGEGEDGALLAECALETTERALVEQGRGMSVEEVVQGASGPEFVAVLYALSLLGVVSVSRAESPRGPSGEADLEREDGVRALDVSAVRERVRARMNLVSEAGYFTLLGVARDATGYEVRRAFLELRRAFEPSRILTPEMTDLEADVRTIVTVLDEAYEILRDGARRERYRRALRRRASLRRAYAGASFRCRGALSGARPRAPRRRSRDPRGST